MKIGLLAVPAGLALALIAMPVASTPLAQAQHPVEHIMNAPRIRAKYTGSLGNYGWSASNWSGYAITGQTYHSITGSWIVPSVTATHGTDYSSAWIGIDGFNNSDLIQTGTEQDASSNGSTDYYAWWEILPASETTISSMTIHPGDQMSASITNNGNGTWTISLTDNTTGQSFSTTQAYSGPAQSAEWIMEAPEIGGHISTLADYGETTFDPGTVNGGNPDLVANDGGVMIQHNQQVSTPSLPDSDTDGFNIAYGATAPAPPPS